MFGLKNIIPKVIISEDSFGTLQKKSEDYRKTITLLVNHLQLMNKIYEDYYGVYERNLA